MATYVNDLRLKEIATGDESGTWGASVNTQYELIAEAMGAGTEAIANASTHTITMADGATDGFRCTFLRLTGGGQACTVTLAPNTVSHTWIIRNATSYALTFTQGSGANVIIAAGQAKIVSTDGAGSGAIVYECLEDLELGGTLTVGIDDTGHDVKFFGATSGAYMLWDESADDLKLVGAAGLTVAGDIDIDGTANLDIVDVDGAVNFAADVTYADGSDIITASAGTSNFRAGVNAGNSIESGGNYNVCVGDEAGTAITTGDRNCAVGYQSLDANDTGGENVSIGYGALTTSTSGSGLVAIGDQALEANTTAGSNTAVGKAALKSNTTGTNNTSLGKNSLDANTTANNNTSVGHDSLTTNQTGASCVAVGTYALQNSTVSNNVAVGVSAGSAVSTGAQNTLIGTLCHDNLTTGEYCIALGYNNGPSAVDVAQEIVIGNSITGAGTNTVRIGTSGGTATLGLDGSDTSWAAASDLRLKKDVADSTVGLSFLNDLRPVTFKWNAKNEVAEDLSQYDADSSDPIFGEGKAHHGFIAQEVKAVIDDHSDVLDGNNIWHEDPDGTQQLSQGNLVPMLVRAIQELSARVEELEASNGGGE